MCDSRQTADILPNMYCSIFMKIRCAQLYMKVNSHAYYCSCLLYTIQDFTQKNPFNFHKNRISTTAYDD